MKSIAILGSGPSALIAAHAAEKFGGYDISLFAPGEKSPIWGAQYLHGPIPGLSSEGTKPEVIRYQMTGKPEDYLNKVYGALWDGTISDDLRDQAHLAWDLREAYDKLWGEWEDDIYPFAIVPNSFRNTTQNLTSIVAAYDIVINTIPRRMLCVNKGHQFLATRIWAMGDSDTQSVPVRVSPNTIQYNGQPDTGWYRTSQIYGFGTVEWPGYIPKPPVPGVTAVEKPISHSCDCFPRIRHLGRMGRWDRRALLHQVYADTVEMLLIEEEK